ncbi:hypothetical protein [Deinococcus sp. AJ005]|uniref:hypothetical protein n=1 Tax=Deinococcus sp. AJ005 TaxID=2652443 RepID=UPI00125CCA20|nr:hypothetical protein [Deinococcus sp. AJ005]QFP77196.1 hypothetical protein DAAJ005_12585 [Deinococcus sp. AJ005]
MKSPRTRTVKGTPKQGSGLSKLLIYAPIALELLSLIRRSQKKKRGKYVKARKRDRALDFLLGQARRTVGSGKRGRR